MNSPSPGRRGSNGLRVFCATLFNETNTFSALPTGLADFEPMTLAAPGSASFEAAFAPVLEAGGQVVGTFHRAAPSGGPVTRQAYAELRRELLADLEACLPVNLVILVLHGAMVADGELDCEGDVLQACRALVGAQVPIVATLDPHAHLSPAMLANANLLLAYKEYPHTDEAQTLGRAVQLGLRLARGGAKAVSCALPLNRIGIYHTQREPMRGIVAWMQEQERDEAVLAVSLIHGFPWGDTPHMGTQALVATDGRPDRAEHIAHALAQRVAAAGDDTWTRPLPLPHALDQALAIQGPVVLAESADNPGGGAPGDATHLLHELLRRGVRAAFGPLWDPVTVSMAVAAGPGAQLRLRIGGKLSSFSGAPVDGDALVLAVSPRLQTAGVGGYGVNYGAAAAIRIDRVDIVLSSVREQALHPEMFSRMAIDLTGMQVVAVKSSQHFWAGFSAVSEHILYADSPGALSADWARLAYRHAKLRPGTEDPNLPSS